MEQRPPWDRPDDEEIEAAGEPTEGVRIIGAEEAAEAMQRGDVAPRRGDGTPRYGDRPESPSPEERPALRFPLGGGSDPADVGRPRATGPSGAPLPPWTDPPTGEVPRIVPERADPGEPAAGGSDDLDVWSSFADSGPRWRGEHRDWDEPDYDDASMLHDDETRIGALDESDRPAPDDYFGFTEEPEEPPVAPIGRGGVRTIGARPGAPRSEVSPPPASPPPGDRVADRDVGQAVLTGVGFAVVALLLFSLGTGPATVLVAAVIVVCAAELFAALQRAGYQPATLLGLVASGSLVAAAYWKGEPALPLVMGLTTVFSLLWYVVGVTRVNPTMNAAVTVFGVAYVGLLGSFAALILTFPNGIGVLLAVIVAVVANDVGALVVGRRAGRTPVAPDISPNKTIEGLAGGTLATLLVTVLVFGVIGVHPWDTGSALALAVLVSVVAPLGDLCESMLKRDLGIKDMSSVLPGHGGLLDRFDALLFALPAAYYLARLLEVF